MVQPKAVRRLLGLKVNCGSCQRGHLAEFYSVLQTLSQFLNAGTQHLMMFGLLMAHIDNSGPGRL